MQAAFPAARSYLHHVAITGSGELFGKLNGRLAVARTDLEAAYAADGPFPSWLSGAALSLWRTADDYDDIDRDVAAELDSKMPTTANSRGRYGLSPDGEKPGVHTEDVTAELKEPGTGFEAYDQWRGVVESVAFISSMIWLVEGVEKLISELGGPGRAQGSVSDNLRDLANVQWESLGRASSAISCLMSFTDKVQDETAATTLEMTKHWSGNAATAAYVNIGSFDDALAAHEIDLTSMAADLRNLAFGMRYTTDFLADVLERLGTSWPDLLHGGLEALVKGGAQAVLARLTFWIDTVLLAVSALFLLVGAFAMTFGRVGSYDVSVPRGSVAPLRIPDVDGPR